MSATFSRVTCNVTWLAVVSMLLTLWCGAVRAHEVIPSIADVRTSGGAVELDIRTNVESFIAGIDLDGLEDTDLSDRAEDYDRLRRQTSEELAQAFRDYWPQMAEGVTVLVDGLPVEMSLDSVEVGEIVDLDLPRSSMVRLSGPLPAGSTEMQVGWDAQYGTLVLRQQDTDAPYTGYLEGGKLSEAFAIAGGSQAGFGATFIDYIPVGFDHIVPKGLDHILFVLGLFFLAVRLRPLLWQVTAFTAAHTVTLALGALGYVNIPGSVVEPIIAASIVYVAVENVFSRDLHPWRPVVVFIFGLLHGLGFASVLGEFGLPTGQFIPALLGFNVGVEVGQLAVIGVALLLSLPVLSLTRAGKASRGMGAAYLAIALVVIPALFIPLAGMGDEMQEAFGALLVATAILMGLCGAAAVAGGPEAWRRGVAMPASLLIGLVGAYWCVERVFL